MFSARRAASGLRATAAVLTTLALATSAPAQTTTWTGAGDRQWGTAGNWTAGVPNTAGFTAAFSGAGTGTATVGANFTIGTLQFDAGDYALGGTGTLTLSTLTHQGGINSIANRLSAANLAATINGGTLSLTNISGAAPNSFTGTSAFTVNTGGTLAATVANTDPFNGANTGSALGDARVVLNGGTFTIQGNLVAGGLTGQVYAQPNITNFNNFNPEYGPQTNANGFAMARTRVLMNTLRTPEALTGGATAAQSQVIFNSAATTFGPIGSTLTTNIYSRWAGAVNILAGGTYTFGTRSDDGALLYVDGVRVVDNNSFQGLTLRTGTISLNPGQHTIEIYHYQGGGNGGLQLAYSGPDNGSPALANNDASMLANAIPVARLFARQSTVNMPTTNVDVSGTSTLNIRDASFVTMNALTMAAGSSLTVGGTSGYGQFATTTLGGAGARTFTINTVATATANSAPGSDLGLGNLTGVNGATIVKTSDGNLYMDSTTQAATLPGLTYEVQGGRLVGHALYNGLTNPTNPIGDQATVRLNGTGATLHLRSFGTILQDFAFDNALQVNANGALEVAAGNPNLDTLYILGSPARGITLSNNATLTVNVLAHNANGGTNRFIELQNGGAITGTGNLIKTGAGEFFVSGANTFTGTTTINTGGDIVAGATNALGTAAGNTVTVNGGGTLGLRGSITLSNPLTISGGGAGFRTGALEASRNFTVGNATPIYAGPITLAANATIGMNTNSFVQNFTINGPVNLQTFNLTFNPAGGAAADSSIIVNGAISGTGNVVKNGALPVILAGNNTYTGATTVNTGVLEARGAGQRAVGTGLVTISPGAVLHVSQPNALGNANVNLAGGSALLRFDFGAGTATSTAATITGGEGSRITVGPGQNVVMNSATATLAGAGNFFGLREGWSTVNGAGGDLVNANPLNGINGGVVTNIRQGQNNIKSNPVANPAPANGFAWGDNLTFIYTGQVRANGNFITFAEQIDDNVWIRFNGNVESVANGANWFTPTATRAIPVTPGEWYDVDIRLFHGGGGAGATGSNANGGWGVGWATTFGFGMADVQLGSGAAGQAANVAESQNDPRYIGTNYFRPGEAGSDPLGTERFRATATAAEIAVDIGGSFSVGRLAGGGGAINLATATGGPATVFTLADQAAATASTAGAISVTGTGPATLTVGTNQTLSMTNLNLATGSTLTKGGTGTLLVNGTGSTGTGALNFTAGTLGGRGVIPGATTLAGGTNLSPGTSVGQLTFGSNVTKSGAGTLTFEYASVDQVAINNPANYGITHDHLNGTGTAQLNLTGVGAGQFTINILFGPVAAPGLINYTIATFAGGIVGFSASQFAFTGPGFVPGTASIALGGTNNLVLTFQPVPEPVHLLVLCGAAAGLAGWVRRRRLRREVATAV